MSLAGKRIEFEVSESNIPQAKRRKYDKEDLVVVGSVQDPNWRPNMLIACGNAHSLCLGKNGNVYTFGENDECQLGDGSSGSRDTPYRVDIEAEICAISVGCDHNLCIDVQGNVWCFGCNDEGQLGVGHENNIKIPQRIPSLESIRTVACGAYHSACVSTKGMVYSFGLNDEGQLGLGDTNNRLVPVLISSLRNIKSVECGSNYSFCVDENNKLFCFGGGEKGQLGLGNTESTSTPVELISMNNIVSIACGWYHTIILHTNGDVYAFGSNSTGELGMPVETIKFHSSPHKIANLPNIMAISCGYHHTMCLDTLGGLWLFGENEYGQLGDATTKNRFIPEKVAIDTPISFISTGGHHTIVKDSKGSIWAFGGNQSGQLGIGDRKKRTKPRRLAKQFSKIAQRELKKCEWELMRRPEFGKWRKEECKLAKIIEESISSLQSQAINANSSFVSKPELISSWVEAEIFLTQKAEESSELVDSWQAAATHATEQVNAIKYEIKDLEDKITILKANLPLVVKEREKATKRVEIAEKNLEKVCGLLEKTEILSKRERETKSKLQKLLEKQSLVDITENEIGIVLWSMGLSEYHQSFIDQQIFGEILVFADFCLLDGLGMTNRDSCCFLYHRDMMKYPFYAIGNCCTCIVCSANTTLKTIDLLKETNIDLSAEIIEKEKWIAPFFLYLPKFSDQFGKSIKETFEIRKAFQVLELKHNVFLEQLSSNLSPTVVPTPTPTPSPEDLGGENGDNSAGSDSGASSEPVGIPNVKLEP